MPIDLITVPWDTARRGERMGAGPLHFLEHGARARLEAVAGPVRETAVGVDPAFPAEIATAFDLARATNFAVKVACGRNSFPLVLAGNCMTALGVYAAMPAGSTGVVWLDAHADLNTPETTRSGFLDGMALAVLLGRCWREMSAGVQGFTPVAEENVVLVGARDLDPAEAEYLDHSRVGRVTVEQVTHGDALTEALDALSQRVEQVYLHLDLDVHDPEEGAANAFAAPHGLSASAVRGVIAAVAAHLPIAALSITAYDPAHDPEGRVLEHGLRVMEQVAAEVIGEDPAGAS
jgi:arginase